ncbi:MAG TPA: ferritin-like domain-containing protein [Polyangiaceae bacterium]|nr:ferritin-like domain-containing protein [Polyangiaceae bacterium]
MSSSSCHHVLGRLLLTLGASSLAAACGGETAADPGAETNAGAAGTAPGAAGAGGDSRPIQTSGSCSQPSRFCLNDELMRSMARTGYGQVPLSPPRSDAEVAAAFGDDGCLRYDWVASSCCNRALGPGEREAGQCCYEACDNVCCGRALVIAERTLVAAPARRSDWLVARDALIGVAHAARPELTLGERARLSELWQADALLEHASIASFARFGLQLLALGAPAHLVREAQRAGLDEIRHAEDAFSIASRLAGRAIGPGPLPELGAPIETELRAVARAALVEGCIGETLAAVLALEQAQHAGDVAIREALLQVAEDETRHAELAFRFVAWALGRGGSELRELLRGELERKLQQLPEPATTSGLSPAQLHHYGRLGADEQRALYRQVYEGVLRPTFAALLDGQPARVPGPELRS